MMALQIVNFNKEPEDFKEKKPDQSKEIENSLLRSVYVCVCEYEYEKCPFYTVNLMARVQASHTLSA